MLIADTITKSFNGGAPALRGVSLAIEPGEFVCIVGRSGSGKSTLLNILSSLLSPDTGEVRYQGRSLAAYGAGELNRLRATDFSMVFQMHHLLPYLTTLENVLTPFLSSVMPVSRAKKRKAMDCLERVGLAALADRLPGRLSGGERQRVAIARALVTDPRIIFADEPTGSLDRATGGQIMDILREVGAGGQTVVMVTHEPSFAAMGSRVVTIADGRVQDGCDATKTDIPAHS